MKVKTTVIVLAASLVAWLMVAPNAFSTVAYSKEVGKPCAHCHVKAGSKDLNDMGKCFQTKKTLEGC